jgi:hypothetical protein
MNNRANQERRSVSSGIPWEETFGYSRAVRAGDHIYVSGRPPPGPTGQWPRDPAGQSAFRPRQDRKRFAISGSLGDVVRRGFSSPTWPTGRPWQGARDRFGKIRPIIRWFAPISSERNVSWRWKPRRSWAQAVRPSEEMTEAFTFSIRLNNDHGIEYIALARRASLGFDQFWISNDLFSRAPPSSWRRSRGRRSESESAPRFSTPTP